MNEISVSYKLLLFLLFNVDGQAVLPVGDIPAAVAVPSTLLALRLVAALTTDTQIVGNARVFVYHL